MKICYFLFTEPLITEVKITLIDKDSIVSVNSCKNDLITKYIENREEICNIQQLPLKESVNYSNLKNFCIINVMDRVKFYEMLFRFRSSSTIILHNVTHQIPFYSQWDFIEVFKYNAYTNSIKIEIILIAKNQTYNFTTKLLIAKEILQNRNTGIYDNQTAQNVLLSHLKNESNEIDMIS